MNAKNRISTVTVSAPATIANLVCGFDILGMALEEPRDFLQVSITDSLGIQITNQDDFDLPTDPVQNVAGVALQAMLNAYPHPAGFNLVSHKQIKPGSGLGSSAASAAGAVVAANILLDQYFSSEQLVQFAMAGEELASGVRHADNVAPCVYGGITLIRSLLPPDIIPLSVPELFVTVIHPQIEIKTSDARQILRKNVLLKDAIIQWGNIAGLVTGFLKNDHALISRSMTDIIIEPVRSILIPGFKEIKTSSIEAGALGGGIAGSGPSIFMLSADKKAAIDVQNSMKDIYHRLGIDYNVYVTTISQHGVRIENESVYPI
ncbi:MAG: homoserine kinase [Chitinophagaceae bacterium]|jgi:homoserine kinase|nr:homoserine kinase [Chitinophagaceae bacterium]